MFEIEFCTKKSVSTYICLSVSLPPVCGARGCKRLIWLKYYDNLTSVLLAGPAILPVQPLAKFNFDILVLRKDPYCILLFSVMLVDAAQKKKMKFGWFGAEIWEFYSRRNFRQDITLVELSIICSTEMANYI